MNNAVLVDVYPWAVACEKHGTLVMEGVFRHAEFLSSQYMPCIAYVEGEHYPVEGLRILVPYLMEKYKKGVQIATGNSWDAVLSVLSDLKCKVWVSLAIDFVCPVICRKTPFTKVTIAHDMLAASGRFGFEKEGQAKRGLAWNDVFAYVSVSTLHQVSSHELIYSRPCKFIKYGCFHNYTKLVALSGIRNSNQSLSVHSIYKRKNITKVFELSQRFKMTHYHIGRRYEGPSAIEWERMITDGMRYMGPVPDETLIRMYLSSSMFISMSGEEGFNMPPMEAIIHGVSYICLADTIINREIYGGVPGVAFFSLDVPFSDSLNAKIPLPLGEEDRERVFEEYRQDKVTENLVHYIAGLSA